MPGGSGLARRIVAAAALAGCLGALAGIHVLPAAIARARVHSDSLKSVRAWFRGARFVRGARTVLQERGNDCGAACLKTVLEMRGIRRSLGQLTEAAGTTAGGASMQGLRRVAEDCGVPARSWVIRTGDLSRLPLPAIAFVYDNHFVVIRRVAGPGVLEVDDPALGRLHWPCSAFCRVWSGRVIVFDRSWSPG